MQQPIIAKGVNASVELHINFIRILRTEFFKNILRTSQRTLNYEDIHLTEIANVNFKSANAIRNGYIHFIRHGTSDRQISVMEAANCSTAVVFMCTRQNSFLAIKSEIESRLKEMPDRSSSSSTDSELSICSALTKAFPHNLSIYAEYTKTKNWKAICDLNGVPFANFGTRKELIFLSDYLEADEAVIAITSGLMKQTRNSNFSDAGLNTWLVVLTTDRFMFLDAALLSKSIDIQSIRHEWVQAVSFSQGLLLGNISIDLGSRVVEIANCPKSTVASIGVLANKWQKELKERAEKSSKLKTSNQISPLESIERLAKLHSEGMITKDEFQAAKAKLLSSL